MPSKLKAGGTFPFILEADRADGGPPQFNLRVLSVFENDELGQLRVAFVEAKAAQRTELLQQALTMTVAKCLIEGYESEPLPSFLTNLECWELINGATEGASLTPDQRKKFVSALQSEMDFSAGDAVASA
jgi:hypothetical protein